MKKKHIAQIIACVTRIVEKEIECGECWGVTTKDIRKHKKDLNKIQKILRKASKKTNSPFRINLQRVLEQVKNEAPQH